jgi:predicted DNA-binding protein
MSMILIAPFKATQAQREWLDSEAKRTGETVSAIIRGLIQAKIDKVKK